MNRRHYSTHSEWEEKVGYSRAVRTGNVIEVAGTTAVRDGEIIGRGDPYEQTKFILTKIGMALRALDSDLQHVTRIRMYVVNIQDWEAIGKAHKEVFAHIRPASTMVEVKSLIHPELLVEIEATAMVTDQ